MTRDDPHLLVTGVGRCGTTFMVELLTVLGLDTGFTRDEVLARSHPSYKPSCRAGLERTPWDRDLPHVIKNPELCFELDRLCREYEFPARYLSIVVCVRDIQQCMMSRIKNKRGPGGLWRAKDAVQQREVLLRAQGELLLAIARHELNVAFVEFPRVVQDVDYAWRVLAWCVPPDVSRTSFISRHAEVARESFVTVSPT